MSWLPFNKTYEKLDYWNGKGYIFAFCLITPLFALGFLGGAISGVFAALLIASVLMLIPILNSLIYRKKQKNPEVYLSRYGAYVGRCLLKFFNKRDGSFITEAVVEEGTFPYITLRLSQTGTGGSNRVSSEALFAGTHISERRILIPKGFTEEATALCAPLSSRFTYVQAMSLKP